MLSGADLDKILDEGYGDSGFNDPLSELGDAEPVKPSASLVSSRAKQQCSKAAAGKPAAAPAEGACRDKFQKPYERPAVSGAPLPPPPGANLESYELTMAMDQAAREKGYRSAEDYNQYLEKSGALKQEAVPEAEEMPLAPGIKKAPAYMPPGAYPGDRTKTGKAYEKDHKEDEDKEPLRKNTLDMVKVTFVKQSDKHDFKRAQDGNTITFRLNESGETQSAEVGSTSLPWALDDTARRMKIGDIVDVVGSEEYAFADSEEYVPGSERHWRFELMAIDGRHTDKFSLSHEERIALAEQLRLRGNDLFKKQRLHRAMHYYERGSALMDVLEAEEMGMPGGKAGPQDKMASERNRQIWQCQKPLLLNWALILMKLARWREAERKCTEVLMDIDKLNVKALFRRGQCNIELGNHEQAGSDLSRAGELDTSIAREVEREMAKVRQMQRAVDESDAGLAKKAVQGFLEAGDARSEAPPPPERPGAPDPAQRLMGMLRAQEEAAAGGGADDDAYCRQREAIYNQFLARAPAGAVEE